jgi:hypothetical protein
MSQSEHRAALLFATQCGRAVERIAGVANNAAARLLALLRSFWVPHYGFGPCRGWRRRRPQFENRAQAGAAGLGRTKDATFSSVKDEISSGVSPIRASRERMERGQLFTRDSVV